MRIGLESIGSSSEMGGVKSNANVPPSGTLIKFLVYSQFSYEKSASVQ